MISIKTIKKIYKKNSIWENLIISILLIMLLKCLYNTFNPMREGFLYTNRYTIKQGPEVFDGFYANYYDNLVFSYSKNVFEIGEIINISNLSEHSKVLDIGAGTGHHVALLAEKNIPVIGLDNSQSMVDYAKKTYPFLNFKVGDALNTNLYYQNSFTHILCLYFTLYYMNDKKTFFNNCMKWLVPGGYLIVHLVDRENFNPLFYTGPPDLTKKGVITENNKTKTIIKQRDYTYTSSFLQDDNQPDIYIIKEKFTDENNNTRENQHTLYMNTQKHILGLAKQTGFILLGKIDMSPIQYDYQYLYILQKPN